MAMQRELDEARVQLKNSERAQDEQRRQAQSSREQAAVYRSENVRLQDELRSTKSRLNGALDSQEELLRKNSSLHSQIHELQNSEAALRDELTSTAGLVKHFQEQNNTLEADLKEVQARANHVEAELNQALGNMTVTLTEMRNELLLRHAEKETLDATCEALRAEIRKKDTEILQRDTDLAAAARERTEVREELQTSHARLTAVSDAQDELREEIEAQKATIAKRDAKIAELEEEVRKQSMPKSMSTSTRRDSQEELAAANSNLIQAAALNKAYETKIEDLTRRISIAEEMVKDHGRLTAKLEQADKDTVELAADVADVNALRASQADLMTKLAEREALTSHLVISNARLTAGTYGIRRDLANVGGSVSSSRAEVAMAHREVDRARFKVARAGPCMTMPIPVVAVAPSSALNSYYALRAEREGRLAALDRARRSGARF
jgi:chromosome segregation ATPase